ncbi:MAG: recombinase zinc beta ribbon domain-containing protein, partial [Sphingomonadaceae bacterium]|nr:recombinase zinc beta ribbon domain-containing protein [Sphingomonadaceae bacterium]
ERKLYTRTGGRWGIGAVHRMLTRTSYIGVHEFNRRSKHGANKPDDQVINVEVPRIIAQDSWDRVQELLHSRNPKVAPPQVVAGPTLLTGICFCADCGGAMTIRTGKSGRYRYYACSIAARQGATGCKGRSIPMEKLDGVVTEHLEERLLEPERLEEILGVLLDRREDRAARKRAHASEMRKRAAEAEGRLKRLYEAIESGVADLADTSLKERIAELRAIKSQAETDAERAAIEADNVGPEITPAMLSAFASAARRKLRGPDGRFRRDHLRALAQRVEVADREVRIMGSRSELLRQLAIANGVAAAASGVPRSVPKWRRGWDSNPR